VIKLFRMNSKVEAQLRKSEGLIRYGLKTDIPHKRFCTLRLGGQGRDEALRCGRTSPDGDMAVLKVGCGQGSSFVEWENSDGKIDCVDVMKRL
jgi:hypothetical protein